MRMRRTNDQDVVELVNAVDLGQQLVDHCVVDSRAPGHRASGLTDGIYLIKNDDVQSTVWSHLCNKVEETGYSNIQVNINKSLAIRITRGMPELMEGVICNPEYQVTPHSLLMLATTLFTNISKLPQSNINNFNR